MSGISRRHLLAATGLTGAALLAAAGIGSAVAALADLPRRSRDEVPALAPSATPGLTGPSQLVMALARERELLANLAAAQRAQPGQVVLANLADDHRAHAQALATAIGAAPPMDPTAAAIAPSIDQLKAAEQSAHDAAATDSASLRGADAVLLASIAACEAGHVELLT